MLRKIVNHIASLLTTLMGLGLFVIGIALVLLDYYNPTLAIAPGFLLLLINLVCAILVKEKIRSNAALLIFHLSLLTLMCLVIASRLTYMKGWLQVNEGETFSEMTGILRQGIWYPETLNENAFKQLHYKTLIEDGGRTATQSYLALPNIKEPFIIRDQTPLKLGAYQFTLSSHIGYSIIFNWLSGFNHYQGHVLLPPYSRYSILSQKWTIPNSDITVELLLDMDTETSMQGSFKMPTEYQLVISHKKEKITLKTGESHSFEQGQLTFLGLKRWIGYDVFYDWTIPWLLVTCLLAIGSLGVFLWGKNTHKAWDE